MPLFPSIASRFMRTTKVIAVVDVVESVRLMEQDEQEFIRRWQRFVAFVQEDVLRESGRLHKSLGDGLMLAFSDPYACIGAALAMHAWFREFNQLLPPQEHVQLRIGAHLAEFVADQYDIYGNDVNLAARIASLAGPGEIVISATLRERLGRAPRVPVEDLGPCHLKHVKRPVHAFRIGRAGGAPVIPTLSGPAGSLRVAVAVLPFAQHGEAVGGICAETLADELVTVLARSDAIRVVSRMATGLLEPARETPATVPANARYVLSGRARTQAGELALYLELANARSGHVISAERVQPLARATGRLDPQSLVHASAAIHAAIIHHEVEATQEQPFPTVEGSSLLAAAIGLMHRLSPVDMDRARRMLDHLAERWRRHPYVHAWLAHLHVLRILQCGAGGCAQDESMARTHAAAAVHADPASPLVLALDGHACLHGARNLQGAADRYAQALSARPEHALALLFQAELLVIQGWTRSARATIEEAAHRLALEPMRYMAEAIAALAAWADGDAEAAVVLARQALQRNPRYLPAWHTLVVAQVEAERLGEARATQQRLLRRQPAFSVSGFLGTTPMGEDLAHRFADGLVRAGAPRG
jgi:class 3 adenylate cyclase/TolB-like protein